MSLGDLSDVGTPGPIPNPAVKHVSADGTWRATSRESRSLPRGFSFIHNTRGIFVRACVVYKLVCNFAIDYIFSRLVSGLIYKVLGQLCVAADFFDYFIWKVGDFIGFSKFA
jgi:hypothetical protein